MKRVVITFIGALALWTVIGIGVELVFYLMFKEWTGLNTSIQSFMVIPVFLAVVSTIMDVWFDRRKSKKQVDS